MSPHVPRGSGALVGGIPRGQDLGGEKVALCSCDSQGPSRSHGELRAATPHQNSRIVPCGPGEMGGISHPACLAWRGGPGNGKECQAWTPAPGPTRAAQKGCARSARTQLLCGAVGAEESRALPAVSSPAPELSVTTWREQPRDLPDAFDLERVRTRWCFLTQPQEASKERFLTCKVVMTVVVLERRCEN